MVAPIDSSRNIRRVVCLLLSTVIVAAVFVVGALEAQKKAAHGYTITIEQLQ